MSINNVNDLCTALEAVYEGLKSGALSREVAAEMNNALGKLGRQRLGQVAAQALHGAKVDVPFYSLGPLPALPALPAPAVAPEEQPTEVDTANVLN